MCDVAEERDAQLQSGAEPEQTSAARSPSRGFSLAAIPTTDTPLLFTGKYCNLVWNLAFLYPRCYDRVLGNIEPTQVIMQFFYILVVDFN